MIPIKCNDVAVLEKWTICLIANAAYGSRRMIRKPLLFTTALMIAAASAFAARDIHGQIGQRIKKVRTTAYTYSAAENGSHPTANAIGKPLKAGKTSSAAAD